MKKYISSILILVILLSNLDSISQVKVKISKHIESTSIFKVPIELKKNNYLKTDLYIGQKRAATGFNTVSHLKNKLMSKIKAFAKEKGKKYEVLGEQTSKPPHIMGNYQRIEIIFVLLNKPTKTSENKENNQSEDKYDKLNKLKKLLDNKVITQKEFDSEKAKILKENCD